MFDKILFDRNAFDRSVSSDGLNVTMIASGDSAFRLVFRNPIAASILSEGAFIPKIVFQQRISEELSGAGELNQTEVVLRMTTVSPLTGAGAFIPFMVVKTPIEGTLSGGSHMGIRDRMFLYQNMGAPFSGSGIFDQQLVVKFTFDSLMEGSSEMNFRSFSLQLPLQIQKNGSGGMVLRRIGALNENVIELIGIDFKPGDVITIDTDLLQVLFGAIEDVSSITTDSVFFELNPGENEIVIDIDADSAMDITAVWQNRWL